MIMFPGIVISHEGVKKVVVSAFEPNDNLPKGRCALMQNGHIEWHDTRMLDAEFVHEFPKYVEVGQHNYREKQPGGGYSLYHKAPFDMLQAMLWAIEMGSIRFLDVESCGWGCGLYKVNNHGVLEFMYGYLDSSG